MSGDFSQATQDVAALIPHVQALAEGMRRLHQTTMEAHAANAEMHRQNMENVRHLSGAVDEMTKRLTAPRRVVRDAEGRITGMEIAE